MRIRKYYQRQSRYKKPLFIVYAAILVVYMAVWVVLALIYAFTIEYHLIAALLFCYLNAWAPIWFEIKPTAEEIEADREECRRMVAEYDKKYNSGKKKQRVEQ